MTEDVQGENKTAADEEITNRKPFDQEEALANLQKELGSGETEINLQLHVTRMRDNGATDEEVDAVFRSLYKAIGVEPSAIDSARTKFKHSEANWIAIPTSQDGLWIRIGSQGGYELIRATRADLEKSIRTIRHYTGNKKDIGIIDDGETVGDPTEPEDIARQFIEEIPNGGHLNWFLKSYKLHDDQRAKVQGMILSQLGVGNVGLLKSKAEEDLNTPRGRALKRGEAVARTAIPGYTFHAIRTDDSRGLAEDGFIYRVMRG